MTARAGSKPPAGSRARLCALRRSEHVVLELHADVLVGQAWEISAQHVVLAGLDQIHRRDPSAARAAAAGWARLVKEGVKQPVHLVLDGAHLSDRLPAKHRLETPGATIDTISPVAPSLTEPARPQGCSGGPTGSSHQRLATHSRLLVFSPSDHEIRTAASGRPPDRKQEPGPSAVAAAVRESGSTRRPPGAAGGERLRSPGQSVSPAVAEIVGGRRERTASMISLNSSRVSRPDSRWSLNQSTVWSWSASESRSSESPIRVPPQASRCNRGRVGMLIKACLTSTAKPSDQLTGVEASPSRCWSVAHAGPSCGVLLPPTADVKQHPGPAPFVTREGARTYWRC